MKAFLLLFFLLIWSAFLLPMLAQDSLSTPLVPYQLEVQLLDKEPRFAKQQKLQLAQADLDSSGVQAALKTVLKQLHERAYLAATIDTVFIDDSLYTAYLLVGERYEWAELQNGNVAPDFLSAIGFRERFYEQTPFYYKEVLKVQEKLLRYLEDHGYPFAQVYLDSVRISGTQLAARLYYNKGPLMMFEKLVIKGKSRSNKASQNNKVRIKAGFLSSYLGIRPDNLYSEKLVKKIQSRLSALRYLSSYPDALCGL